MKNYDKQDAGYIRSRSSGDDGSVFERPDPDSRIRNTGSILDFSIVKIGIVLLAVVLVASLLYSLLVPPMVRLGIRLALADNYEVRLQGELMGRSATANIRVDGNIFAIKEGDLGSYVYYKQEEGSIYRFVPMENGGVWKPEPFDESEESDKFAKILDPSNYERTKGSLLQWQLKSEVDVGRMVDVVATKSWEKFIITWEEGGVHYKLTFVSFGRTPLNPG